MFDVVRVSRHRLIGEVIEMHGDKASIQVYEETAGLGSGEPVETTGEPLSVELGPGILGRMYDGIQRPLEKMREEFGSNISRGIDIPALDREKKWTFNPTVSEGTRVVAGDIIGTVQETVLINHKIMVPNGISSVIESIKAVFYSYSDCCRN